MKRLLIIIVLSLLPIIRVVGADSLVTGFSGETTPGIMTRMELHWGFGGTPPERLSFRLIRFGLMGDTAAVFDLPGEARKFEDRADPGLMTMHYRLEAWADGTMLGSAMTEAPVAHAGGFKSLTGKDVPHDGGGRIELEWTMHESSNTFEQYRIYRTSAGEAGWKLAGTVDGSTTTFTDDGLVDGSKYHYMVRAVALQMILESMPAMNLASEKSWFDMRKINLLVIALLVIVAVIYYTLLAGRGTMYIRRIAGLQAVDEAVGRATEMGRSVLFVPGIQDLDDVQTIAGLTILGSVAKMTAQYETRLDVPVSRSLVMSNGREVVKESYMSVGRPDFYNDSIVHYVTDEQFGYVAAVDGIMVRERPAACFYLGAFFAESLILAETGNHVGAIQIAGTAMPTQLPFFVAACDYTLIGEELFAASAYLSKDARAIAALRGQDVGKALAMGSILFGSVLVTIASMAGGGGFFGRLSDGFVRLFALNF
ncbi:MAG: fibronectin type III domain-containing protein [Calditrichaeota bacterium]|nr:fibronectin type III domain-containing protein [Calditrichota bacterium]